MNLQVNNSMKYLIHIISLLLISPLGYGQLDKDGKMAKKGFIKKIENQISEIQLEAIYIEDSSYTDCEDCEDQPPMASYSWTYYTTLLGDTLIIEEKTVSDGGCMTASEGSRLTYFSKENGAPIKRIDIGIEHTFMGADSKSETSIYVYWYKDGEVYVTYHVEVDDVPYVNEVIEVPDGGEYSIEY